MAAVADHCSSYQFLFHVLRLVADRSERDGFPGLAIRMRGAADDGLAWLLSDGSPWDYLMTFLDVFLISADLVGDDRDVVELIYSAMQLSMFYADECPAADRERYALTVAEAMVSQGCWDPAVRLLADDRLLCKVAMEMALLLEPSV